MGKNRGREDLVPGRTGTPFQIKLMPHLTGKDVEWCGRRGFSIARIVIVKVKLKLFFESFEYTNEADISRRIIPNMKNVNMPKGKPCRFFRSTRQKRPLWNENSIIFGKTKTETCSPSFPI